MIRVNGLKNCDTCRSALAWLADNGLAAELHDFRRDGLDPQRLDRWIAAVGWEALLNRRGTTWRGLAEADKANVDAAKARELMLAHPALIKRPVFEVGEGVVVGFKEDQKAKILTF